MSAADARLFLIVFFAVSYFVRGAADVSIFLIAIRRQRQ